MRLSGIVDEEAAFLRFISDEFVLDFKGLLFAAIIIGASGAAMDGGGIHRFFLGRASPKGPGPLCPASCSPVGLSSAGALLGTMSNTLILAYVGGAIHLILLLYAYPVPFSHLINRETVAAEILIALCGSMGMLSAIPLTALISSLLHHRAVPPISPGKSPE